MLPTLFLRRSVLRNRAFTSVRARTVGLSRPLYSEAGDTGPPKRTLKPKITTQEVAEAFEDVFSEPRERGLRVRADGFVSVGDVINKSLRFAPKMLREGRNLAYDSTIPIGTFVELAKEDESFALLHEPPLHCLGDPKSKLVWWIRKKKQPSVPKGVDQVTNRIMPGTKIRNAIYKAKVHEWPLICKHGLRPRPGREMIIMTSVDKIDEADTFIYVFIDMEEAMKAGVEFFYTRHYQVVSPGNEHGIIPPQLFKDAVKVTKSTKTLRPLTFTGPQNDRIHSKQKYEVVVTPPEEEQPTTL